MPSLKGRSPSSAYAELLKISNTGAGLDGTLRNIEDGAGNQTGIQLGTGKVAIFGYQFPASGFTSGQVLRINSANNAFEWHTITAGDVGGLAAIAKSGLYSDLSGAPTIPTNLSQLSNDAGYATTASILSTYGSGQYVLPTATATILGGIKLGTGLTAVAGVVSANVTTVAGRTGAVVLAVADVSGAAALASPTLTGTPLAPTAATATNTTQIATTAFVKAQGYSTLVSPTFTGIPLAPTATAGTNTTQLATTAFVTTAVPTKVSQLTNDSSFITAAGIPVQSVAGRTGAIVLSTTDISGISSYASLVSPTFSGSPAAPTATVGTNTTQLANTAFVQAALPTKVSQLTNDSSFITVAGAPVQSVAGRTGSIALSIADISGGAPLASPALTGIPSAPTATAGTNTTQLATTAFVTSAVPTKVSSLTNDSGYVTASTSPVTSVATRTGAIVLTVSDISGAAPTASPTLTGVPVTPTAIAGTNNTQIASTAFVSSAITAATPTKTSQLTNDSSFITAAGAPVQSVAGRTGAVILSTTDISGIGSYALLASPSFTGVPAVPTATAGTNTTQAASTAFVASAITTATPTKVSQLTNDIGYVTAATSPVTSVAGRTGVITLAIADVSGGAPLASPTFTGTPAAPTAAVGTNTTQVATTAFATAAANATVTTFNTRAGAVTLSASDVTTALGFTPYNATNPSSYISANQTITVSGDATGSGATTIALALASVGTAGTYSKVTTDAKGRVTSGSAIGSSDVTTALGFTPENVANKGVANGYASLDATGKLTAAQIPASLIGAVVYQGTWNASTNIPTLTSGVGTKGYYYKVATAGSTTIDGNSQWIIGDTIIFDGSAWDKIDGNSVEVISVAGRSGVVTLTVADISGGAALASPTFTGIPAAPTATAGTNTTQLATTAFVASAISAYTAPVTSVAGRTGTVVLSTTDISGISAYAPLASPSFTGTPVVPTATAGANTTQVASTAFVTAAITTATPTKVSQLTNDTGFVTATTAPVTLVAGRTGSITLAVADISGAAPIISPTFTGVPAAPTATAGTSTTQLATTAFVTTAIPTKVSQLTNDSGYVIPANEKIQSVAGRTGTIVLAVADVNGAAALASPTFTGIPAVPTASAGTNTTQAASTAFVTSAITTATPTKLSQLTNDSAFITASGAPVQSVAGRSGVVVLAVADISGAAPLASPTFTGIPVVPTATSGTNTTQAASTAFVNSAISSYTAPVTSVAGRTGTVVLSTTDISGISSYAPLANPTFTGIPIVPTATTGTNTTQAASTAFVNASISAYVAPVTSVSGRTGSIVLSTTDISGIANYALLVSPALTGSPTAPTASLGTSTTQVATTAFVQTSIGNLATVATTGSYTDLVNTPIYNFDGGNSTTNSLFYQIVNIDGGTH
jgi:hypothetical protein